MNRASHDHESPSSRWIEVLHEAIASHSQCDPSPDGAEDSTHGEFEEVRECLTLLERARRTWSQVPSGPRRVGRFEILREIGRGGFGVVFAAIDPRVGRQVALKVPRPEVLADPVARDRFLREARAAGALSHPNLIPVFEVGHDGPFCYIASALCEGPTLAEWIKQQTAPIGFRMAAELVRSLAAGVEHAHYRGVLHRDIKPSNVLLEPAGSDSVLAAREPRLTDFGLAKIVELADDQTRTGALVGTPAYMSPEQAEGRWRDVGPATDVYALGAVLFELLAGRPPLKGESDVQTLQLVAQGDVPPPTRFRPGVPRDLESIVLKCLECEPTRRYVSAQQLADDLSQFLAGRPTVARPTGPLGQTLKWIRRRPATAALAAMALVSTVALSGGGWWYTLRLSSALAEVQSERLKTDQHLYVASVTRADRAIKNSLVDRARSELAQWIPQPGQPDRRGFAWHHLWRKFHEEDFTLRGHTGDVYCVRYSSDGTQLATASQDRTVRIWDANSGTCLFVLEGHEGEVNSVAFSQSGKHLASVGDDGMLVVWRTGDGTLQSKVKVHKGPAFGVAFSPVDGTHVATCGTDARIVIRDIASGKQLARWGAHAGSVGAICYSPMGKQLATGGDDGRACIWDVKTNRLERRFQQLGPVNSVQFSPDANSLLTCERSRGTVRLYNAKNGDERVIKNHHDWVHAAAFEPSMNSCAIATKDGAVELINLADASVLRRFCGHATRAWSLDFSNDGHLATASADRTVKIWNLANHPELLHESHVQVMSVTPDGRTLAVGDVEPHVTVYDLDAKRAIWNLCREFQIVGDFNGDGQRDSGTFNAGTWRINVAPAGPNQAATNHELTIQFGPDGIQPLVGDWDGDGRDDVGFYDPDSCKAYLDLGHSGGNAEITIDLKPPAAADRRVPIVGRWEQDDRDAVGLATYWPQAWRVKFGLRPSNPAIRGVAADRECIPLAGRWQTGLTNGFGLWDRSAGVWIDHSPATKLDTIYPTYSEPSSLSIDQTALDAAFDAAQLRNLHCLAISPDGGRLAVSYRNDYRLHVWDIRADRKLRVLRTTAGCFESAAFSPDGSTLTTITSTGELTMHDVGTFRLVRRIQAHESVAIQLAYSADGRLLATLGDANVLRIWDAQAQLLHTFSDSAQKAFNCLTFSADHRMVAVGGDDRIVRIWDLETGRRIASLAGHVMGVTGVAFSPDMRCLASSGRDGAIKLWDLDTRHELYTLAEGLEPFASLAFAGDRLIAGGSCNVWRDSHAAVQIWPAPLRDPLDAD